LTGFHRLDDVAPQGEMFGVAGGNDDALFPGQSTPDAGLKESFDLFVHAVDRLHLAAGYRDFAPSFLRGSWPFHRG
jgi:hypothetical protein